MNYSKAVLNCTCILIIIFGVIIFVFCIFLGLLFLLSRPSRDTFITDEALHAMRRSGYSAAYIAVFPTSKSPLNSGFLQYSEETSRYILPHQSRLDTLDIKQIIAALGPITVIEKSPCMIPSDVDCVFYCWISKEPLTFYIKVTESQLVIWHKGHIYQGGNSDDFIALISDLWIRYPDANQVQVKIFDGGVHVHGVVVHPVSSDLKPPDSGTDSGGKNDAIPNDVDESFGEFDQNEQKATRE